MNALFNGMGMASLGRMEEELGSLGLDMKLVLRLLAEFLEAERSGQKAPTVLSAHENGDGPEWDRMKVKLIIAGVPGEELDTNSDRVKEILAWVVNNGPDLDNLSEVDVDDSVSQHDTPTILQQVLSPLIISARNTALQVMRIPAIFFHPREEVLELPISSDSQADHAQWTHDFARVSNPPSNIKLSPSTRKFRILFVDDNLGRKYQPSHTLVEGDK